MTKLQQERCGLLNRHISIAEDYTAVRDEPGMKTGIAFLKVPS
jgi:hypothetical protein